MLHSIRRRWRVRALVCLIAAITVSALASAQAVPVDEPIARAKAMIAAKDPNAAYALLVGLENLRGGEPEFDYWFGIAAFESNHLERAAMAFERALVVNPDNDSARLELARTYLRMGSLDLAQQELTRLLSRPLSTESKRVIETYLSEIVRLKEKERFSVASFVEVGGGRDNNLSSATQDFSSAVLNSFGLSGISATGNSIRRGADYGALAAGVEVLSRYREDRSWFLNAAVRGRSFSKANDFNYALIDLNGGHEWRQGEGGVGLSGFAQRFNQDGAFDPAASSVRINNNRSVGGVTVDWRMGVGNSSTLGFGLQGAVVRYATNKTQDTNQYTITSILQTTPFNDSATSVTALLFYTGDKAVRPLNPDGGVDASRKTWGARAMLATDARLEWSAQFTAGWSRRRDDQAFARASLVANGRDDLAEVGARVIWRFAQQWSLQPYLNFLRNQSNISIYSFRKTDGGLTLRRDFK